MRLSASPQTRRGSLSLPASAAFLGLLAAAALGQNSELGRTFNEPVNLIIVQNPDGRTEVQTWRRDLVQVIAERPPAAAARPELFFNTASPGVLQVRVQPTGSAGRTDLTLYVPSDVHISVRSEAGPVTIHGRLNGISVETDTGPITLHLPEQTHADLALRAPAGNVSSRLPLAIWGRTDTGTLDGRLGHGGVPIIARSSRGSIQLLPDDPSRMAALSTNSEPMDSGAARPVTSRDSSAVRPGVTPVQPSARNPGPGTPNGGVYSMKVETRLVNLNVRVTDASGTPIPRLQKQDFMVLEDGKEQKVSHFSPTTAPINLVLLLDLSGSTRDKMKVIKRAAWRFVQSLGSSDKVAVAAFTARWMLVSNFTNDRKLLKKRIGGLKNRGGSTQFYDAMWSTLDLLDELKEARKAVVVLTDGVDSSLSDPDRYAPRHPFDGLLRRMAAQDATLYPIYLDTEYEVVVERRQSSSQAYQVARTQLAQVAEQTGGVLFKAARVEDLEGVYEQVAADLRTLYSLAYYAPDGRGRGWRQIEVRVNRPGSQTRTRKGYYAD